MRAMHLDQRLLRLARLARLPLAVTILLGLAGGALAIAQARLLSLVIGQTFLMRASLAESKPLLGSLFCIILARAVAAWGQEAFASALAQKVKLKLRQRLAASLLARSPASLRVQRAGELLALFQEGIEALDAYFGQYLPQLALAILLPVIFLAFVFPLDWISAVIMLVTAPLIPVFMLLIGNLAQGVTRRQWLTLRRLSAYLLDVLQGLTTLKALGRSRAMAQSIEAASQRYRETTMSVLRVTFLSALSLEMVATLSTAVIAVEVGLRLLYGRMAFEQAFFILLLAPEFYLPLRSLGARFHAGMAGVEAARKLFEFLPEGAASESDEVGGLTAAGEPDRPWRASDFPPEVTFDCVHFAYAGGRPALDGASFVLHAGQLTALVGLSGAGKSTLADLLLRFREPDSGRILVGGQPLDAIPRSSWLEAVAYVSQSPYLFNDSVLANLVLARPGASQAEVVAAAQSAHADEFISRLPEGYATPIGEGGARLSAGQAQRLALGRALLKRAPLLILDEGTAHLDAQTEAQVQDSLRSLRGQATILAIAHRLNTALAADQVIVLEGGRVVESGSPAELLQREGAFYRLVQSPQAAFGADLGKVEGGELLPSPQEKERQLAAQPVRDGEPPLSSWRVLARLLALALPRLPWIGLAALLGFATVASSVGLMGASAYIIAAAALQPSIAELQVAIVGVRFFGVARGVFRYLERLVSHQTTFRLLADLRLWFYQAVEPLAPAGLLEARRGDLLQRVMSDISSLESFYVRALAPPLVAILVALSVGRLLAGFDPALAWAILLAWLAAGVGAPWLASWLAAKAGARAVQAGAAMSACLLEGVQASADLAVYRQEDQHRNKLYRHSQELAVQQRRLGFVNALQVALSNLAAHLGMLAVLGVGILLVERGALAGVYLAVVVLAALTSFEAAAPLPQAAQQMGSHLAAARRLFEVAAAPVAVSEPADPVPIPAHIALQVDDLTFQYTSPGQQPDSAPILDGVAFDLPPGKRLAIVGLSGSGKTTLLNLLLRFYEIETGEIRLNGRPLAAYGGEDLRRAFAVTPQQAYIFNATLRDNLLLAHPAASQAEIEQAIHRAGLADFIAALPQGLETWAGEGGTRLSAGESQRLALARALLKPSRLLLLDEPTAHLDTITERAVMQAIIDGLRGASLLLITHRLVGMPAMDEILVLEQGRVIERGTHRELLARQGRYRRMWDTQNRFNNNE